MSFLSQLNNYQARKRSRLDEEANGENNNNVKKYSSKLLDSAVISKVNKTISSIDLKETKYRGPPHFIIVGVQKGGTTAARHNLNKHSEIFVHPEIHFFDYHYTKQSSNWYFDLFKKPEALKKTIIGEKTPELIYIDPCAERIKEVCPHAKFILFLRNPIERAYSEWNMNRLKGDETRGMKECVESNLNHIDEYRSNGTSHYHYVQKGFYMDQIERFQRSFPDKNQLLIIISEHIRTDPVKQFLRIFDFLGAKYEPIDAEEEYYCGEYERAMDGATIRTLQSVYQSHNERLFNYLGYRITEWDDAFVEHSRSIHDSSSNIS